LLATAKTVIPTEINNLPTLLGITSIPQPIASRLTCVTYDFCDLTMKECGFVTFIPIKSFSV